MQTSFFICKEQSMSFSHNFSQGISLGSICIQYIIRYPILIIFTTIPTILNTLTALSFLNTLLYYSNAIDVIKAVAGHQHPLIKFHLQLPHSFLYLTIIYIFTTMLSTLFTAALQHYTKQTLDNQNPSFLLSLKIAFSHVFSLILWNILSFGLYALMGKMSGLSRTSSFNNQPSSNFLTSTLTNIWSFTTFFVIPFIIFDNHNVFTAIYKSYEFTKNNFSQYVGASIAIKSFQWLVNSILLLFLIPCISIVWYAIYHSADFSNAVFSNHIIIAFIIIATPLTLFIFPLKHTTNNIFAVVLYNYSHNEQTNSFKTFLN